MSRDQWYAGVKSILRSDSVATTRKLSNKTSDPQAKNYDEATEIFLNGLTLARRGDFEAAAPQIACAYLLDGRSINFTLAVPENIDDEEENTQKCFVDFELLKRLIEHDTQSVGSSVLRVMLALWMGPHPQYGQELIASAMVHIQHLLNLIEDHREIEHPDSMILGGCLSRKELLRQRSSFHMALGNHKEAMRDLTKALKIDDSYTAARSSRACIWGALSLKDHRTVHDEFKRIIEESHQDDRGNEVAYAWLAMCVLNDHSLGSFRDARTYYEKSLAATERRNEIYGRRGEEELPDVVKVLRQRFAQINEGPMPQEVLENLDIRIQGAPPREATKSERSCLNCGAKADENGKKLSQCARCKAVYYCSADCQRKDWKNHKKFCKIVKNDPKTKSHLPKSSPQRAAARETIGSLEARRPRDQWTSNMSLAKRLEVEFKKSFQKYGNGFSQWWKTMSKNEKTRVLMHLTNNSIPLLEPSPEDITMKLSAESPVMSRALFDYNVQRLCGKCECSQNCDHYYNEMLLHEMSEWALKTDEKEKKNFRLSNKKQNSGVFPDLFHGKPAFVTSSTEKDMMGSPLVFTESAPADEIQKFRGYVRAGLMQDASVAQYATSRKIYSLSLFTKLFDEFQIRVRRVPPVNPLERLQGCRHYNRSCNEESAKKCPICKVSWFCCEGCMVAAGHRRCPHGQECESKAIFN